MRKFYVQRVQVFFANYLQLTEEDALPFYVYHIKLAIITGARKYTTAATVLTVPMATAP